MAAKKSKKASKRLKRGKKIGAVKTLTLRPRTPGPIELNPQPLPP
jgi:hypothetical protein